ncbi:hypothetical protein [Microbacterium sp. bgisy189]|uniref:hypothetical protein n=1 Tax=Microbacterium sp. bgisy189 TaxID=3413798 RepID=UPI003EB94E5A
MLTVIAHTARLWLRHWPALMAWMLGGTIANYLILQGAAQVGARTALGGILLLPLAALALLVAYVAMLLVLREGMPRLGERAPLPETAKERRIAFLDAVLGGILPFVLFYAAWGFIAEDVSAYLNQAFELQFFWGIEAAVSGAEYDTAGTRDDLGFNPLTVGVLVTAYLARWVLKKFQSKLPKWTGIIAVYLEALWVYLAAYLVADALAFVNEWVQSRVAMVWLADIRESLVGVLAPLGFLWDGIEWLLGEAAGIILLPVAWLTIAGVIYGQAVKAEAPELSGRVPKRLRGRYARLPELVRKRLSDWGASITAKFRPIGAALLLMWRAGPVLIGGYILAVTVLTAGEEWFIAIVARVIGPYEYRMQFIIVAGLVVVASVLVEPVRIAVISAVYDRTLGRLSSSVVDPEPDIGGAIDAGREDDGLESIRVSGDEDHRDEIDRRS